MSRSETLDGDGAGIPGPYGSVRSSSDGVYGIDAKGLCTFVNRAALLALNYGSTEELVGLHMREPIHHTKPDGTP